MNVVCISVLLYPPPHINNQGHEDVRNMDYGERINLFPQYRPMHQLL